LVGLLGSAAAVGADGTSVKSNRRASALPPTMTDSKASTVLALLK
jgi:hypothetical protein